MEPRIVFKDDCFLVIDKPAGMVVNRAKSVKGQTVQDLIESKIKSKKVKEKTLAGNSKFRDFYKRSGIVHRLDKETSGLLIVARTPEVFKNLQSQFKKREVEKKYLALVHGRVKPEKGEVEAPVGRLAWNRERFGVFPGGRPSRTKYKVKKYYRRASNDYTLLELSPVTGRTHQIRVHLKYLGHPVVSDSFYAGRKTAKRDRSFCPRLFLHAFRLLFTHPKTGKKVSFSSKLPRELERALKTLT